jgi:hypothetical protein
LDLLMKRVCSYSLQKTRWRWRRCFDHDELKINMSSKKSSTNRCRNGRNTSFMSAWKVAGAFVSPNGITMNSNSPSCPEHRLLHVVAVYQNLVVAGVQIELGEERSASQLVERLFDDRDRELVADGLGVQCPIVDTELPRAVGLLDEDPGRERR